ncbi:MAG: DUF4139 domain-containing protein [Candidatus Omnitrophica bacterium]|nr:DUF4139 domain-containing protein [Candidatus Omnitrophota bacterium]
MKTRSLFLTILSILTLSVPVSAQTILKSTIDDQTGVEVTVYNNNLGLVKDTRNIQLSKGEGELRFMDVAAHIMPVTVHAKSLNHPDDFYVLEQNYEYDLINSEKLLDKYVGKKIKIIDWNKYQDRKEIVEAELLSNNQGQIYKINDEIYLGHPGYKVLPEIPENLIAKPTLTWLYDNKSSSPHNIEVSYLTSNIGWKADYVLVLNQDDTEADLSGWVTLDNRSGATYKDAKLKLVAGEVNRVEDRPRRYPDEGVVYSKGAKREQFQEKAFFEYHIYDLQRKTTIKNNQTKQVSLLEAAGVKTEKELLVYGVRTWFTRRYNENIPKQPVNVYIKFKNEKENNLGMPIPAGIMRLYKEDDEKSLQFIGEDRIDHTPKDEEIRLKIGEAFDVVCERKQTDYKKLTTKLHETEWEITLRNHKEEAVAVGIIEPLYGNWQVVERSHAFEKVDAFTIRFDVKVPKDGEVKVNYRIRVGLE